MYNSEAPSTAIVRMSESDRAQSASQYTAVCQLGLLLWTCFHLTHQRKPDAMETVFSSALPREKIDGFFSVHLPEFNTTLACFGTDSDGSPGWSAFAEAKAEIEFKPISKTIDCEILDPDSAHSRVLLQGQGVGVVIVEFLHTYVKLYRDVHAPNGIAIYTCAWDHSDDARNLLKHDLAMGYEVMVIRGDEGETRLMLPGGEVLPKKRKRKAVSPSNVSCHRCSKPTDESFTCGECKNIFCPDERSECDYSVDMCFACEQVVCSVCSNTIKLANSLCCEICTRYFCNKGHHSHIRICKVHDSAEVCIQCEADHMTATDGFCRASIAFAESIEALDR